MTGSLTVGMSAAMAFAGLTAAEVAHAAPTTRYVSAASGDDQSTTCSQAAPCRSLQHALEVAAAGDTVRLSAGSYEPKILIDKSVHIIGPRTGTAKVSGGKQAGLLVTGASTDVSITRLTVTGVDGYGIGVAQGAVLSVTAGTVTNNLQGGIFVAGGKGVSVADSTVTGNTGGGIGSIGGEVAVTNSTVSQNKAGGTNGLAFGFGVYALSGSVVVTDSTIADNSTGGVLTQGAFDVDDAPAADKTPLLSLYRSTVSGSGQVGVVAGAGTRLRVDTSTISGNKSIGLYVQRAGGTVGSSTIAATGARKLTGDGAPTAPAGIYYETRGTQAGRAAAAVPSFVPRTTTEVTIGKRTVAARPQVQRRIQADTDKVTVTGSALDQSGTVKDCVGGNVTDGGYNLSSDSTNSCSFGAATSRTKTASGLGRLADNSGPTLTQLPAPGSPLLNAIPFGKADCVRGTTDQRILVRPQGTRCDIGAVEVVAPLRITTKSLPSGQVGEKYGKTVRATGGQGDDLLWSLAKGSSLPAGLSIDQDGVISGTPTKAGTYSVTVRVTDPVTDAIAPVSKRYTLVIAAAGAGPNDNGADPIAQTGVESAQLTAWGSALVLFGLVVLLLAAHVGRRPGRHRTS